ncbi:MAG: mannose-1-phosphate guanylyltransferase [Candidatus Cloacimonetes bacterium]|nr:mannose-1-phosphate guanylyltransferase [Candidatus Cloacimonadota bacterium]MCF7813857.1 mannose-1-phosphate guanylyltransferase [Candidatus Cloacimonadota bacterium]MCF7868295.1 mannose-1-phosphate guanylyltransferase [Candidatus Cloacimonadota bacterium]MCF7883731.1 mannose-1-phosphate guanylyltransferase [Candidatus Cloacimonadota bacterium]
MIALIMAGGVGTRFWPLSRESNPKQFLNILSDRSMIQMTVDRLTSKIKMEDIFIVTAASQVELTKQHLPELPEENIIIEPFGMNTAPCIALSASYLARKHKKTESMIVLPADHLIALKDDFLASLQIGEESANLDNLVTFGIKPNYPATGYGYIEAGKKIDEQRFFVKQFKEKPDMETAQQFLEAGNFFWNSGMFMWKIETILQAYNDYLPKVNSILKEVNAKWDKVGLSADFSEEYKKMPKIPVDIGIMEQAEKRVVIPVDYGWSDVGSWKALYDISQKDENENVLKSDSEIIESKNNYVNSAKFVSLIGVENLVVVESEDALLIADKDKSEDVKKIVEKLKNNKKKKLL